MMIDLLPSAEQEELVASAAAFIAHDMPISAVREIALGQDGFDRAFVRRCADLGWFTLGISAEWGGVGYSLVEEALLFRLLGHDLVPGPFVAMVLGGHFAAACGNHDLVEEISSGTCLVGLGEVREDGQSVLIWDAGPVDVLLVFDRSRGSVSLVERAGTKVEDVRPSIDPAYRLALSTVEGLGSTVASDTDLADALSARGTVLVAAQLVGIAERTRDMSALYATERIQFGKPIGAFQAVKHRAADCALRAESALAQTLVAALRLKAIGAEAAFHVAAAKVVAADAAIRNGRDNIQNHGAIGFTAEHDAHLYLKRAHVLAHVLGDVELHRTVVLRAPIPS